MDQSVRRKESPSTWWVPTLIEEAFENMEQKIQSLEESFVEKLSDSINEPTWLKEFRLESLRQFKVLPGRKVKSLYKICTGS